MEHLFDAEAARRRHEPSKETRTVIQRRCWAVVFNVNGNAPADADVAMFATKELAEEALKLWAAIKDDGLKVFIVVDGRMYTDLAEYSVEGYNFDTWYHVVETWTGESVQIFTSLIDLRELCCDGGPTDLPDGIYLADGEGDGDSEEDEDGEWSN